MHPKKPQTAIQKVRSNNRDHIFELQEKISTLVLIGKYSSVKEVSACLKNLIKVDKFLEEIEKMEQCVDSKEESADVKK